MAKESWSAGRPLLQIFLRSSLVHFVVHSTFRRETSFVRNVAQDSIFDYFD